MKIQSFFLDNIDNDNPFDESLDDPMKQEIYMINMNEYLEYADYGEGPTDLTGEEATSIYLSLVEPALNSIGVQYILSGSPVPIFVDPNEPEWDRFAILRYPSEGDLGSIVMTPEFQQALPHKFAGLKSNITLQTHKLSSPSLLPKGQYKMQR